MKTGIHIIQRRMLPRLEPRGVEVPAPHLGVLDLARAIEGLLPEPPPQRPLGIIGLDALMRIESEEAGAILRRLRRSLHDGKGYFEWKQIPLVFLTRGELTGEHEDAGPALALGDRAAPLAPLFGSRLRPVPDTHGWWWAAQPG